MPSSSLPCSQMSRMHERRLTRLDRRQRLGAVGGFACRVALVAQHPADQHPDVGFVVYDQDVMRHG